MTGEILSLETAQKLKNLDKAIKYIKDVLMVAYGEEETYINLEYIEEVLMILESKNGKNNTKGNYFKTSTRA